MRSMFTVARRYGAWGREHVAERQVIQFDFPYRVGDLASVFFMHDPDAQVPIIVWSERPLYHGAMVRIYD